MSQDHSNEPQEIERCKLVFLHNIDDFETNAIKKSLIEENIAANCLKYRIFGSMDHSENLVKVMHDRHPIEIFNPAEDTFIQRIINCDILVFNANSTNFEKVCIDLSRVIKALEDWLKEQMKIPESKDYSRSRKYLILVSTPMTWALTAPDVVSNEEEDSEVSDFLLEDDYRRRKAHRSYCKHKILERDVIWLQKKCKHFVRTLVVCPGVTYGAENDKLHYIFKLAFYNKQVPILRPGSQLIPLIYIKDFVQIMKDIFDNFPEPKFRYIFAVQPTLISLKTFTYHISKSFNGNCSKIRFLRQVEMLMMEKELFSQSVLDSLSLNIKMAPTYFKDFDFCKIRDEFWDNLAQEFRDSRNVHPLRLIVDGPPLVGKTEHAQKLSEYYQLLYIDIRQVVNDYIKNLEEKINDSTTAVETFDCTDEGTEDKKVEVNFRKFEQDDQDLVDELKHLIENWSKELFKLKVYIASHKNFEDQDFEQVSQCLIALISTKQYNENQGYIIDSFPFTYDQANQIFYNTRRVNILTASSNEQIEPSDIILQPPLKPTHFIMFDATDELLCKRAMNLTENEAIIQRCLRHQMLPRLDAYRERNEEPYCAANLFYDNELIPITVLVENDTLAVDTLRKIKMEIGSPFIYPLLPEQQKALDKTNAEKHLKEEAEQRRKKEELVKSLTLERERKLLDWTAKYEEIREHENELLEVKTLPLREYLGKYVLPTLTDGILKIAELKPDDPVDFLAEYLFKCNPEGQQMPPFCTEEQRTRFLNAFHENLTNTSNSDNFEKTSEG